ncbi:LysR family transcriptional regulator [uncultured Desulfuromusa sp.]|uniref:LysR family transcriptional regulator n=1 Tax=uncultured Desulfuromusa sp. TaxID=219183 RepID=UPI002AA7DDD9|nr:LysR family transcriptional regulator [uncultured Desulfuromusa sp.]
MDRQHLMEVFVAVAETESFSGAARRLNLSAASVTRAIATLETNLQVKLLNRTTRSVRVTDAGHIYLAAVRRILDDIYAVNETLAGARTKPSGKLSVTAPVEFGKMFINPVIVEYLELYSEMEVSALFLDRVVNLQEEGVDVGIRIGELPDSNVKAALVGEVRKVVCASTEYLANHGEPKKPADLTQHLIVSSNSVTPTVDWKFRQDSGLTSVRVNPRLSVSSVESAIGAVSSGFGITRLLSYQVAPYIASGKIKYLLTEYEPLPLPIHVLHLEGRYASAKVRTFVDLAVAKLRTSSLYLF